MTATFQCSQRPIAHISQQFDRNTLPATPSRSGVFPEPPSAPWGPVRRGGPPPHCAVPGTPSPPGPPGPPIPFTPPFPLAPPAVDAILMRSIGSDEERPQTRIVTFPPSPALPPSPPSVPGVPCPPGELSVLP